MLVAGCAYVLPDAEAYAREWGFQLVSFAVVPLPFLLVAVGVMLWMPTGAKQEKPRRVATANG